VAALNELHAEVALAIALADLIDRDNARMLEAGGSFRFAAKALQVLFSTPRTKTNHFERYSTVETFLMRAINYALTTAPNFLEQFVIAKVSQHSCPPQDGLAVASVSRTFLSICYEDALIAAGIDDPGYSFVEQTEAHF
jgi:hypothetical protein